MFNLKPKAREEYKKYKEEKQTKVNKKEEKTRNVFVIYGRNNRAGKALVTFLNSVGLHTLDWTEAIKLTGKPSPYIKEILDAAFKHAQAFIVLMTPDDTARLRDEYVTNDDPPYELQLTGQARANVIFEAGMAVGREPNRVIFTTLGKVRPFTDIQGIHILHLGDSVEKRIDFANRLKSAGCQVNLSGTTWSTSGDFSYETIFGPDTLPAGLEDDHTSQVSKKINKEISRETQEPHSIFIPMNIESIANGSIDDKYLGLPYGRVSFNGIPFDVKPRISVFDAGNIIPGQSTEIELPLETYQSNITALHMLINAGGAFKYDRRNGRPLTGVAVGKVTLHFSDKHNFAFTLVLGQNLREWAIGNAPGELIATVTDLANTQAWNGVNLKGKEVVLDKLKISIPGEFVNRTLNRIVFQRYVDSSDFLSYSSNPAYFVCAVTLEIQEGR